MKVRIRLAIAALLIALVISPTAASAWSNGPDGADGFGTHDWILYQALVLAHPTWVDTQTALFATDDPDSKFGEADKPNHFFLPKGTYRGAPDTVTSLYKQALTAYQSQDTTSASRSLGLLAHYYEDICVPFHTMTGFSDSALHLRYELQINAMTTSPDSHPEWVMAWKRGRFNDIRALTIDAALLSRATYPTLATQYALGGLNESSEMITRVMLSRAINDLADIIQSIPEGSGVPTAVKLSTSITHPYPSVNSSIALTAKCVDADGLPAEGVRVRYTWVYPNATRQVDGFTGPDGVVRSYAEQPLLVMGRRVNVSASLPPSQNAPATSAAMKASWFVPTDTIGYVRTTVSTGYPTPDQVVTASTTVLNASGRPIAGLPVTFTWNHKRNVLTRTVTTGADGIARHTRNIGQSTKGYRVKVEASVPGGGVTRYASASFVPQNDIGDMRSTVSTLSPVWDTRVAVSTTCFDPSGRPLAGVPVEFAWRFRSGTYRATSYTDSGGVARSTHNIKKATIGYPIHVTSSTRSGSSTKSAMTWFTVQ